jgi:hypothetical protein
MCSVCLFAVSAVRHANRNDKHTSCVILYLRFAIDVTVCVDISEIIENRQC